MILELQDISITHNKRFIVSQYSCSFTKGCNFLVGANGSGKTTIARSIMGDPQYALTGSIYFLEDNITDLNARERSQLGIFLSWQNPPSFPGIIFSEFCCTYLRPGFDNLETVELMHQYADILSLDHQVLTGGLHQQISGGEKKKVELIQLMLRRPTLAIIDEIDSGMDDKSMKAAATLLKSLLDTGKHLIIITHNKRFISLFASYSPCIHTV